ncbi:MAG: patatin-like phospholipase family protein [Solirubrobacteraceae bacterium]
MSERETRDTVALVLAGGGARGAYEAGALSVLLPVLEDRGERPRILIGTSVGALNISFLAANAQLSTSQLIADALMLWETIRWGEVARRLVSGGTLLRLSEYAGEVLGVPGARLESLLDSQPLRATLRERIDFDQLERNIQAGALDAAGVVATSALTSRSVVFHSGLGSPSPDRRHGIDYVATPLVEDHVLASAAIPAIFPAVHVKRPQVARGWYFDGGTRLNTPIKPALEFGAGRVVVIALNSLSPGPPQLAGEERPDALEGAGQILLGLLDDQLTADVLTLATINELTTRTADPTRGGKRQVPYIVVAPAERDAIGQCALRVFREHYSDPLQAIRSPDIALLARLIAGGADAQHAELLSFLLFAPEFTKAMIGLGQEDARRWISQTHDLDQLWQIRPI